MKKSQPGFLGRALPGTALVSAFGFLSSCSAGLGLQPPLGGPAGLFPTTLASRSTTLGPKYAYISDGNFVDEFDRNGQFVTKITTGLKAPQGIFVDPSHNVWVTDAINADVVIFPEGATSPIRTLKDTGAVPTDVTVGADGTAYVANAADGGGPGSIAVYPPGHDMPARKLQDPAMLQYRFITVDGKNDLFATTAIKRLTQFVGRFEEFAGAKQSGLRHFNIQLGSPGGIKWVGGMLYVCDTTAHTVTQYTEAGAATGRRLVTGGPWDGIDLTPDGKIVLGADQGYVQGISRTFPWGKIVTTYADPQFQAPTVLQACSSAASPRVEAGYIPDYVRAATQAQHYSHSGLSPTLTSSILPSAIYVADALKGTVDVFNASGKLTGTITKGLQNPAGLVVDGNQNLSVANNKTVTMYANGQSTPSRTLVDANGSPDNICVARDGTVYVTNFFNGSVACMLQDPTHRRGRFAFPKRNTWSASQPTPPGTCSLR